ncbi:MAG: hypothetical protein ACTHOG_11610 [Marmoricola sp.]
MSTESPAPAAAIDQISRVLSWDWRTPLRVAGATLGTSLVLGVVFGLASRPASSQLHWGFKTTLLWVTWVWESIFGVNAVGGIKVHGSLTFFDSTINGGLSGGAGLGAMPLTLTVITLVVAGRSFHRATTPSPNALSALMLGVRAALLTALPLFVVSLVVSVGVTDVAHLVGASAGDTVQQWQSLQGDKSFSISVSSTDAFFVTIALLVGVFAGITLLRGEWFTSRGWSTLQLVLAAPLRAFARLAVAVVVGGLLFELVTWLVRWNTSWPNGHYGHAFTAHQWVNGFATAIAYGGNAGAMALGLGSLGKVGYSASGGVSAAIGSESSGPHQDYWIGWFAQNSHLAWGIWSALLIAPAILIYVALSIARVHGTDARAVLTSLGTWLVSLVVAVPVLAHLANLSAGASGTVDADMFVGSAHGTVSAGLSTLIATFLIFAYALLICAVIAARARFAERSPAAGTAPPSSRR